MLSILQCVDRILAAMVEEDMVCILQVILYFCLQDVYVTLHEKTKHNALDINMRYRSKLLLKVIIIIFHLLILIDRGIIPLTKICFVASRMLYSSSYGSKSGV